jgi:hypothetical protein
MKLSGQWLNSVTLAIQEAEIGRMVAQGQHWQEVHKTSSQTIAGCSGGLSFQLPGKAEIGQL